MYEYAYEDVVRKFNKQIVLASSPTIKKNYYYLALNGDENQVILHNADRETFKVKDIEELEFSYVRFQPGFYPLDYAAVGGSLHISRLPVNRNYGMGFGHKTHCVTYRSSTYAQEVFSRSTLEILTKLRGTFDKPVYTTLHHGYGALSLLYSLYAKEYIFNLFGVNIARCNIAAKTIEILKPEQEFLDYIERNDCYKDWKYV